MQLEMRNRLCRVLRQLLVARNEVSKHLELLSHSRGVMRQGLSRLEVQRYLLRL